MTLCLTLLAAGCATKQVEVEGNFPTPLLDPLPITLGVIYPSAFAKHEFFDEAKGRAESDWLVKTGEAQVEFWDILFGGMFDEVVHIRNWETVQSRGQEIDGVLIPAIADLQYTIPTHTNVKIYEIWMRYEFRLVDIAAIHQQEDGALSFNPDERLAAWPITAYGKTPTAFLQTDEEAVNLAAVVALRDAEGSKAVDAELLQYINRLSDWLFTAARFANQQAGIVEDPWIPRADESDGSAD